MPVNYDNRKIIDVPSWHWLSQSQVTSNPGTSCTWDGKRFMYWVIQSGTTTSGTASTTQLWRYDTWTNGWQFLATTTSGNNGIDIEYDNTRNLLYIMPGVGLTALQVFNLNSTAVTVFNQSMPAWALTTVTIVLPAAANTGASLTMPDEFASNGIAMDNFVIAAGATATSLPDNIAASGKTQGTFGFGMVGLYARATSGALAGQRRLITASPNPTTLTVAAFAAAPAAGDTFVVELPEGAATGGTLNTVVMAGAGWTVNQYANSDVIMLTGANAGARRRIASNDATTLTLTAAVTGNARTGNLGVAVAAGDTFRIVPSGDFLYYQPGNNTTTFYRVDVVQTTGAAWAAALAAVPGGIQGGGNTFYPGAFDPFGILAFRGNGTNNVYRYLIGTNVWTTPIAIVGGETFNTGAQACMIHGRRKIFVIKESAQRCLTIDLTTGIIEPITMMPYALGSAYDGKRARFIRSPDGAEFIYLLRPGGQEFYRLPLEWLV